jgi:hypothetical protein
MEADLVRKCLARGPGTCSFMTYEDFKVLLYSSFLFEFTFTILV